MSPLSFIRTFVYVFDLLRSNISLPLHYCCPSTARSNQTVSSRKSLPWNLVSDLLLYLRLYTFIPPPRRVRFSCSLRFWDPVLRVILSLSPPFFVPTFSRNFPFFTFLYFKFYFGFRSSPSRNNTMSKNQIKMIITTPDILWRNRLSVT